MKVHDRPWGDPWVSYRGEPVVPVFGTNDEFKRWCGKLPRDQRALAKLRCAEDRAYFIHNYCWFKAEPENEAMRAELGFGWTQFRLWPCQLRVLTEVGPWSRIVAVKVRQVGFTWMWGDCGLRDALFRPHTAGFVFSYRQTLANKLLGRIKATWKRLPDFLVEGTGEPGDKWSTDTLSFTNGSTIEAFPTDEAANLGDTYNWGIFDEMFVVEALAKKDLTEMVYSAMLETLRSSGGWFVGNGTGRYRAGCGWRLVQSLAPEFGGVQKAEPESLHDWKLVFVPITEHPYWTEERIEAELATHPDPLRFWREHPRSLGDAFAIGGDSVFSGQHMNRHLMAISRQETPVGRRVTFVLDVVGKRVQVLDGDETAGEAWIYVAPVPGHVYLMALDTTRSYSSRDFCAGVVLDVQTGETVCVVHAKFNDAIAYADYCMLVGRHYNDAMLIPETNLDTGMVRRLVEKSYVNLYRRRRPGDRPSPHDEPEEALIGWHTNPGTGSGSRSMMLARLKSELCQPWLKIYHEAILDEMGTFVTKIPKTEREHEREEAAAGSHDDLVMALAIAVYVARDQPECIQLPAEREAGLTIEDVLCDGRPPKVVDENGAGSLPWSDGIDGGAAPKDDGPHRWFLNA